MRREGSAIFHFVHSDMMKYLITVSEHRREGGLRHAGRNEEGRQKRMKCNRRGAKEKSGFGRRDRGRHEQASKCQGEMNSWRRNLHREVCVCLMSVCTHMHLYTDAYSYLVACLKQTCPRKRVNIICKNKHLPIGMENRCTDF